MEERVPVVEATCRPVRSYDALVAGGGACAARMSPS